MQLCQVAKVIRNISEGYAIIEMYKSSCNSFDPSPGRSLINPDIMDNLHYKLTFDLEIPGNWLKML